MKSTQKPGNQKSALKPVMFRHFTPLFGALPLMGRWQTIARWKDLMNVITFPSRNIRAIRWHAGRREPQTATQIYIYYIYIYNIGHTLFSHHDDYLTDAMRLRRENKRNSVFFSPAAAIINRKSYYNWYSIEKMPPEGRRKFLGLKIWH